MKASELLDLISGLDPARAAALLDPGGCVIVRIPLSDSFANSPLFWRSFGKSILPDRAGALARW